MDVYATFEEVRREYTVNFFNGDLSILSSQQVEYGSSAATPSDIPWKLPEGDNAYKFEGWNIDYSNITGDLNVYPEFSVVDRYYDVRFYDELGNIIDLQIVEYLNSAVEPNVLITKEETESTTYEFIGWDKDFSKVTENLDIYPLFKEEARIYLVSFMIDENNVYEVVPTPYGQNAAIPSKIPYKQGNKEVGYKFIAWNENYQNITGDTFVYAIYEEVDGQYLVTFTDGDIILSTQYVLYGKDAVAPNLTEYLKDHPNKDNGYEYYFISWSDSLEFITKDMTINLNKGQRLIQFEVTIINGDETTISLVDFGKNVALPQGYKTDTDQIKYSFIGWDDDGLNIRENRIIKALFEETYLYYEVRFYDKFNSLIKLEEVAPNGNAKAPAVDIIDQEDGTLLVFSRWDKDFTEVTENLNVYAIYNEVPFTYTVNFYDAFGNIIETQVVKYNEDATPPNDPVKVIDGPIEYIFIGWDKDFRYVKENLDIYPEYKEEEITYIVNFYDGDGKLIKTDYVKYGLNAVAPQTASKSPTDTIYYLFNGWDKSYENIKSNLDVFATFNEVSRYYSVVFFDENNNVLDTQIIEYGNDAKDPRYYEDFNPIISYLDNGLVLVISGWDQDLLNVKENRNIYAIYDLVPRYYDVNFYDDNGILIGETQIIEYGSGALAPSAPEKLSDNNDYFYLFTGWSSDYSYVTSNLDIYPIYDYVKTTYQVTFLDGNGDVFNLQEVDYGSDATTPNGIPSKRPTDDVSYIFIGWDIDYTNVTKDLIVRALYEEIAREYLVIFKNSEGIIIKEELVRKNNSATAPNVTEIPSDEYYHYIPKWTVPFDRVTEDIVTELYYEKVERIYTLTFYSYDATTIIDTITATYGQVVQAPMGPEKPMDRQFLYTFRSWNPVFNEVVTEDINYYPYYDEELRTFTVTFLDGNDEIFEEQVIPYGQTPNMPQGTPTSDENDQYYYTFRMWETLTVEVYDDITIRSIFYSHLQEYEVTFIDEFGNVIEKQLVKYGEGAIEPESSKIPEKSSINSTIYVFSGWDKTFSFITKDLVVQTIYLGTPRKFVYTFYDEDQTTILKKIVGSYGDQIIEPEVENKPGDEGFDYHFIGWDRPVPDVLTEHINFVARYERVYREYQVSFIDGNGMLFKTVSVKHGSRIELFDEIPSKLPTQQYIYIFSHWVISNTHTIFDIENEIITNNLTLKAQFETEIRKYKVTYLADGIVHAEVFVEYNKTPIMPADPEKEGYRFTNWDRIVNRVTTDITVNAVFVSGRYNIIFKDGFIEGDEVPVEGFMDPLTVNFDEKITLSKLGYHRKGYDFMGWIVEGDVLPSYGDEQSFIYNYPQSITLIPYWQPITYGISYDLNGGLAFNPSYYTIEDYIRFNQANKNGYKFAGWYMKELENEEETMRTTFRMQPMTTEDIGTYIEEILPNTIIGSIKLTAVYEYDSYIKLKDESLLGMYHAEITSIIPIEEREYYDEDNPIYLMGVFEGQTWANLKENFINNELYFLDKDGNELSDDDVVASGRMIVIKDDDGNINDRVHIVLKGDTNGDGRITINDIAIATNIINKTNNSIIGARLLAAEINGDGRITINDIALISNHVNNNRRLDRKSTRLNSSHVRIS